MSTDTDTASVTDDDIRQLRHAALCAGLDFEFSALLEQRDALARRVAELESTMALQQASYEREIRIEVEAERERCAKLCDGVVDVDNEQAFVAAAQMCAAAIRTTPKEPT